MPISNITEIRAGIRDQHGHTGDGTGGGNMESRLAKLESDVGHIQTDTKDIKNDIRLMLGIFVAGFLILLSGFIYGYIRLSDHDEKIFDEVSNIRVSLQQVTDALISKKH
jgi:hypothetical protein